MKYRIRDILADIVGVICLFAMAPLFLFLCAVFGG
jgi:hypothetical protein